ncbi:sigma-54 interaction domain-containing protein [Enterobacter ludwigii]|uniref:sigma-54 interaction domain-containing protein n=1 Tax=Enterobacter ludwigii TaxID=299767 RepID=UPI003F727C89
MSVLSELEFASKEGIIACSAQSKNAFSLALRVSQHNVPVLICGETGTGKECLAKYIHQSSGSSDGPYVGVNCAAIPETMLEAMLFGYEKGAFTGAITSVMGKFELANGGTLLLDEIGDMPLALQAKLLRVLQEQEVERLGSHKRIPLKIRLITSTNKDLEAEVAAGRFRQDLFYRIAVVPIHIAPLRERQMDILPLVHSFLRKYQSLHPGNVHLSDETWQSLLEYDWPGNVRELENVVQRGLILSNGHEITAKNFGLPQRSNALSPSGNLMKPLSVDDDDQPAHSAIHSMKLQGRLAEYQYIIELLARNNGNKSRTAEFLGITPRALRYRLATMREEGIEIAKFI